MLQGLVTLRYFLGEGKGKSQPYSRLKWLESKILRSEWSLGSMGLVWDDSTDLAYGIVPYPELAVHLFVTGALHNLQVKKLLLPSMH